MKIRLIFLCLLGLGASLIAACGSSAPPATPTPSGDPVAGQTKFMSTCSACHGPNAKGIPGLGKDLTTSTFAKGLADSELVAFVIKGRDASEPLNTTGVAMPPKGGNPALTEKDLGDIVAYLRTLEK